MEVEESEGLGIGMIEVMTEVIEVMIGIEEDMIET